MERVGSSCSKTGRPRMIRGSLRRIAVGVGGGVEPVELRGVVQRQRNTRLKQSSISRWFYRDAAEEDTAPGAARAWMAASRRLRRQTHRCVPAATRPPGRRTGRWHGPRRSPSRRSRRCPVRVSSAGPALAPPSSCRTPDSGDQVRGDPDLHVRRSAGRPSPSARSPARPPANIRPCRKSLVDPTRRVGHRSNGQ